MGFKIFTHDTHSSFYDVRVDNFRSYESISKDIIQRQNITQSQVGQFTYIGKDMILRNNMIISNSDVGDGCEIGCNEVGGSFGMRFYII